MVLSTGGPLKKVTVRWCLSQRFWEICEISLRFLGFPATFPRLLSTGLGDVFAELPMRAYRKISGFRIYIDRERLQVERLLQSGERLFLSSFYTLFPRMVRA